MKRKATEENVASHDTPVESTGAERTSQCDSTDKTNDEDLATTGGSAASKNVNADVENMSKSVADVGAYADADADAVVSVDDKRFIEAEKNDEVNETKESLTHKSRDTADVKNKSDETADTRLGVQSDETDCINDSFKMDHEHAAILQKSSGSGTKMENDSGIDAENVVDTSAVLTIFKMCFN